MPRKKKEENKVEETKSTTSIEMPSHTEPKEVPKAPLTEVALGLAKNNATGMWHVITIPYNPETGDVGKMEKSTNSDIKAIMFENYQIAVVNQVYKL